jgi:hypothetical protein
LGSWLASTLRTRYRRGKGEQARQVGMAAAENEASFKDCRRKGGGV